MAFPRYNYLSPTDSWEISVLHVMRYTARYQATEYPFFRQLDSY